MSDLQSIRGVEIVKVGTWEASTGTWTVTADQLRCAVEAFDAGVERRPVIKIGHDDQRFDGTPSFGYLDQLRLTDGGDTLVADLCGLPAWLAEAIPRHYPDRSVEALCDYQAPDGTTWPLVVTGVALLGATAPAISSLASLQQLVAAKRLTIAASSAPHRSVERTVTVAAARRRRAHRKATA